MPKTNTELIRELLTEVAIHGREIDQLKASGARLDNTISAIRTDIAELTTKVALLQQAQLEMRNAVQESLSENKKTLDDFKKQLDGFRTQLWWFFTILLGSMFTIIVTLVTKK